MTYIGHSGGEKVKSQKFIISILFFVSAVLLFSVQCNAKADQIKKLYVYNWSQYMDPEVIKAFEKKYDVKVVRSFYESNPSMYSKLVAGGDSQYDVVFP